MGNLDDARAALDAYDTTGCVQPEDIEHLRTALDEVDRMRAARAPDLREILALRAALCATLSEEHCRLDHHGRCQEHGPGPIPCPVPAAWTLAVGAPLPPEPEPSALALFMAVLATDEDPGRDLGGGDCGGDRG